MAISLGILTQHFQTNPLGIWVKIAVQNIGEHTQTRSGTHTHTGRSFSMLADRSPNTSVG